ncbi:MAG: rhomboid family intramembrane serine protease, partial [Metallibacterium sp.]
MLIRLESRHRRLGPRWATLLLTLICVLVYAALTLQAPGQRLALLLDWGSIPRTLLHPPPGPWWRVQGNAALHLLTALFMHADVPHLVGNMAFLLIFGLPVERAIGSLRLLLLFLIGGMLAN